MRECESIILFCQRGRHVCTPPCRGGGGCRAVTLGCLGAGTLQDPRALGQGREQCTPVPYRVLLPIPTLVEARLVSLFLTLVPAGRLNARFGQPLELINNELPPKTVRVLVLGACNPDIHVQGYLAHKKARLPLAPTTIGP